MSETYDFRYRITPTVIADAIRLHQATFIARYRVVTALLTIVGLVLLAVGDPTLGLTIAIAGTVLLATTWFQFLDRWLYRYRGRGVIGSTCEYVVDDSGIHYQHSLGSGVIAWSALTHLRADDKSIVFGRDRVMAAYVPTAAFASPAERESFLAFARARVGDDAVALA